MICGGDGNSLVSMFGVALRRASSVWWEEGMAASMDYDVSSFMDVETLNGNAGILAMPCFG